jgi:mannose-6-phosphate isomerase-like protein (cupin superfamily)
MSRPETTRREFAALLPSLLAAATMFPESAHAQQDADHPAKGEPTPGFGKPKTGDLPTIVSGVYTPSKGGGMKAGHESHSYLAGMLTAGNIQIEMHESIQEPGAVHEPVGKHLHSEIWCVKDGTCELMTNGVIRTMRAGDVGICCAGDQHYIRNVGDTQCTYFVVTVGPPETPAA